MLVYYAKRAFKILQEDGPAELHKASVNFLKGQIGLSKRNPTYFRRRNYFEQRLSGYSAIADPFKIITVSPGDVNRYTPEFGKWESVGLVAEGDWDKEAPPVEDMMKYRAVKKRFQEGMTWEDTGIIDYHCQRLAESDKESVDGCHNRYEYKQWYKEIDELYTNIKNNGYNEDEHGSQDHVAVHIGRNGDLLFAGSGCHRLSICKVIGVSKIPVWVRARHTKWQGLRDDIYNNGLSKEHDKELRNHPDLQDVFN